MQQKLMAQIALNLAGENKELRSQISETWDKIVSLTYGEDAMSVKPLTEQIMREEYEAIKKLKPRFQINKKSGTVRFSGLDSNEKPQT